MIAEQQQQKEGLTEMKQEPHYIISESQLTHIQRYRETPDYFAEIRANPYPPVPGETLCTPAMVENRVKHAVRAATLAERKALRDYITKSVEGCECPFDNENTTIYDGMGSPDCKKAKSCAQCIFDHAIKSLRKSTTAGAGHRCDPCRPTQPECGPCDPGQPRPIGTCEHGTATGICTQTYGACMYQETGTLFPLSLRCGREAAALAIAEEPVEQPDSHEERMRIRRAIQNAGHKLFESLSDTPTLQWIAGDFQALNEDWAINHKGTYGFDQLMKTGYSHNQLKWIRDLKHSLDFYKRRCDEIQKIQSQMRDPERQAICAILANGFLLSPFKPSTAVRGKQPDDAEGLK